MGRLTPIVAFCVLLVVVCSSAMSQSEEASAKPAERWHGPFGGTFTATFAVVSDYSFGGISQTMLQPAFQPGFSYKTPSIGETFKLSAYLATWGSNINFATTGPGIEIDVIGGVRLKAHESRLTIDLGYVRYAYPDSPGDSFYDYGDYVALVGYDFDVFQISGRVRYSPNSFGNSGTAWSKRVQIIAPLPFLRVNENVAFKVYGTLGNQWVERFLNYGIPSNDYWYWQIGLVTSLYGVDITAAYTDTSIDIAGCGNTPNCQGRIILSVSKAF